LFARAGIGAGPWALETKVACRLPACHLWNLAAGGVRGGGDLWVAEDRSMMGGAPQARFVL